MTREKAIKILRETYCGNKAFCELFRVDRCRTTDCEIYHAIKALEVTPKHGHWIRDAENFNKYYCSECGYDTDDWGVHQESDPIEWQLPNYCENCGARMDERE